jgi:hypothetical protein
MKERKERGRGRKKEERKKEGLVDSQNKAKQTNNKRLETFPNFEIFFFFKGYDDIW